MDKKMLREKTHSLYIDIYALYYCLKNKLVGLKSYLLIGLTIMYALSPIDFIPDFIPVLGYLDDFVILPFLITLCVKSIPPAVWEKAKKEATQKGIVPVGKWYYALLTVLLWAIITLIICCIFKLIKK